MSKTKPSTQQAVLDALGSKDETTASELAAATGLGRSTVSKALADLERKRRVRRRGGGRKGGRRPPDRWSLPPANKQSGARPSAAPRLRPRQLDELVLTYLQQHRSSGPLGPTAVAKGLRRSSGAAAQELAKTLPAAILADLLGFDAATAEDWAQLAGGEWAR